MDMSAFANIYALRNIHAFKYMSGKQFLELWMQSIKTNIPDFKIKQELFPLNRIMKGSWGITYLSYCDRYLNIMFFFPMFVFA